MIHEAVSWFAFLLVHRVLFTITGSINTYMYVLLNVKLICASAGVFRRAPVRAEDTISSFTG